MGLNKLTSNICRHLRQKVNIQLDIAVDFKLITESCLAEKKIASAHLIESDTMIIIKFD